MECEDPDQQAADSISTGVAFRQRIGALTPEERGAFRLGLFGMDLDLAGLLLLRVNEQVVHGWDVHVALDPKATLFSAGVALMMDGLGLVAGRGKPTDEAQLIAVTTEAPDRRLLLAIGPGGPSLTEAGEGDIKATLRLPAEAFVRLVFGRLDPDHTPPVQTEGVDLDLLRRRSRVSESRKSAVASTPNLYVRKKRSRFLLLERRSEVTCARRQRVPGPTAPE